MATAKKTAPAKKTTVKAVPKASGGIEARLSALEKRINSLEEHDIVTKAEGIYGSTRDKVKDSYEENPGLTIVIGLGILVVLLLIIS